MRSRINRTAAAVVLTAAALAIPCGAWFVAGSREAQREASRLEAEPTQAAGVAANRLADVLAARLESLREVESRRPFFHYQAQFHDPHSDCECASITPSPLSDGPTDPLIWTHFQVDAAQRLTLPTLDQRRFTQGTLPWIRAQESICEVLEPAAAAVVAAARHRPLASGDAPDLIPPAREEANWPPVAAFASRRQESREEVLAYHSWLQNLDLCCVPVDGAPDPTLPPAEGDSVVIEVGVFAWRLLRVEETPALVAVREVETPAGMLTQGFMIDGQTVAQFLRDAPYPARWTPAPDDGEVAARVPIEGADWYVSMRVEEAMAQAIEKAGHIRNQFQRTFLGGAAAAMLAGVGIVAMVRQSDRLARQRSRFAASAAHELRTPLTGMRMYSEMLAENLGDPQRTRDYARHVARESERLSRVVSNVLNYSQLERGEIGLDRRPGDLAAAVRECVAGLAPSMARSGVDIAVRIEDPLPEVRFDRDAVFQILQNLIDNAEKYSRGAADRGITVTLAPNGSGIALGVSDRGPGIPPGKRGRLFEPFFRGESGEGSPAGLGLGLTMVRALARAHGGNVTCADAPGGGATFTVTLPG